MEWISVKNELPPEGEWVLVKALTVENLDGPGIFVARTGHYGIRDEWGCAYGDGFIPTAIEIRYWTKLPE